MTNLALGLALIAIALGCGPARRSEPLLGAMTLDASESRGRAAFNEYCQGCHPGGEAGLGPALNDKPFPTFLKRFQVRHGLGSMPSFPEEQLSDAELDDILAYLEAVREHEGEVPEPGQTGR